MSDVLKSKIIKLIYNITENDVIYDDLEPLIQSCYSLSKQLKNQHLYNIVSNLEVKCLHNKLDTLHISEDITQIKNFIRVNNV